MANISDIIERFILEQMEEDCEIELSRNELANFFNCAPSQINYVLSTRFTSPRGFVTESRRGGGGYIKLIKLNLEKDEYLERLITDTIQEEIGFIEAMQLVEGLRERGFVSDNEFDIIEAAITQKALANPLKMENRLRANILKNILISIIRG